MIKYTSGCRAKRERVMEGDDGVCAAGPSPGGSFATVLYRAFVDVREKSRRSLDTAWRKTVHAACKGVLVACGC